jgi:hypothetical protein
MSTQDLEEVRKLTGRAKLVISGSLPLKDLAKKSELVGQLKDFGLTELATQVAQV